MADSSIVITEGSGKNIDTRTEETNANHRQVVVLGDPATNAGVAPVDVTSGLKVNLGTDNDVTANVLPATSGGLTIYRNIDLDETGVNVKNAAGQVYGWYIYNNATTTRYVKLYNIASAPTVGTTTPVMTIAVPGSTNGGAANVEFTNGIAFATGIGIGATTGVADNNTGAPAANDLVINLLYK